ncbi:P2 family phage major capsid protein, partial [Salmonella enterica]|nr:P2 family phage major capsid protein [Salmonella enterica]
MLSTKAMKYLHKYALAIAKANGTFTAENFFTIAPPRETMLRDAIMQNAAPFLALINVMLVEQLVGQVISTGNPGLFTGRKTDGRFNKALGISGNEYRLYEVDSGSFLDYATLTAWANAGTENEFYNRLQAFFYKSIANDLLRVAFNGTHAAEGDTDPKTYPNGE